MTLRHFLQDIIYEACDRIVEAGLQADFLAEHVISNQCLSTTHQASQDSQMEVYGQEYVYNQPTAFFGNAPRALQPLLKRNRRRHEAHKSNSTLDASLIQVKAIRQKLNGACGYYSLYHSSMVRSNMDKCKKRPIFYEPGLNLDSFFPLELLISSQLSSERITIVARECLHEEDALYILRQTFNKAMFFVMMARWKAQLLEHSRKLHLKASSVGQGAHIHWKPSLIKTGVVERAYMDFLLENDAFIGAIKKWTGATYHALPEISLSQLKSRLSLATLTTVDGISKQLLQDHRPHAFLIGQLNHWIAIVSNRVVQEDDELDVNASKRVEVANTMDVDPNLDVRGRKSRRNKEEDVKLQLSTSLPSSAAQKTPSQKKRRTKIETILLDSRNDFVLNMSAEDIPKRVCKRVRREFIPTGSLWHDMCIRLYEQSLRDTQYSCDMFHSLSSQQVVVDFEVDEPSSPAEFSLEDDSKESSKSSRTTKSSRSSNSQSTHKRPSTSALKANVSNSHASPHPITTELILLYVAGFFESYSNHVADKITIVDSSNVTSKARKQKSSSSKMDVDLVSQSQSPSTACNTSSSTQDAVNALLDVPDIFDWLFRFTIWIQEYSPLRTIEDNFLQSLRNAKKSGYAIPESVPATLEHWVSVLNARLAQAERMSVSLEGSDQIIEDLNENTIPFLNRTCKYLRRK